MGAGNPASDLPLLLYIPGNAVQRVNFFNQYNDFAYQTHLFLTAALPAPATAGVGALAWVSDSTSRTFGAAPTGGGAITVPVYCDGTAWYVG